MRSGPEGLVTVLPDDMGGSLLSQTGRVKTLAFQATASAPIYEAYRMPSQKYLKFPEG